jgi:hypothetical protein
LDFLTTATQEKKQVKVSPQLWPWLAGKAMPRLPLLSLVGKQDPHSNECGIACDKVLHIDRETFIAVISNSPTK